MPLPPRIIITGTPCTGKSTVADLLGARLGVPVTHVNALVTGKPKKTKTVFVNLKKLRTRLLKTRGVIESHLLCEFGLPSSTVFVLRCNPAVLAQRMKKRGYSARKRRENLECEALDYCSILAEKNYGGRRVFDVDTTKQTLKQVVEKILEILQKRGKADRVDFSKWLLKN